MKPYATLWTLRNFVTKKHCVDEQRRDWCFCLYNTFIIIVIIIRQPYLNTFSPLIHYLFFQWPGLCVNRVGCNLHDTNKSTRKTEIIADTKRNKTKKQKEISFQLTNQSITCDTGCRVNSSKDTDLTQQLKTCNENRSKDQSKIRLTSCQVKNIFNQPTKDSTSSWFTMTFFTKGKNKHLNSLVSGLWQIAESCGWRLNIKKWLKTLSNPKHTLALRTPDGWGSERQQMEKWETRWHFSTTYGWTKDYDVTNVDVRSEERTRTKL